MSFFFRIAFIANVFLFVPSVVLAENIVFKAQRFLNILGYDAGIVDGLYGGKTKLALEEFNQIVINPMAGN